MLLVLRDTVRTCQLAVGPIRLKLLAVVSMHCYRLNLSRHGTMPRELFILGGKSVAIRQVISLLHHFHFSSYRSNVKYVASTIPIPSRFALRLAAERRTFRPSRLSDSTA